MAETTDLANNYVLDDQIVNKLQQNNQQTSNQQSTNASGQNTEVSANDSTKLAQTSNSQSVHSQQTTLQELPQTGINTQIQQPSYTMISISLFLIAAGIILGFTKQGGEP